MGPASAAIQPQTSTMLSTAATGRCLPKAA
jgi:hypothetical protein